MSSPSANGEPVLSSQSYPVRLTRWRFVLVLRSSWSTRDEGSGTVVTVPPVVRRSIDEQVSAYDDAPETTFHAIGQT
jgi:hypothetical protein